MTLYERPYRIGSGDGKNLPLGRFLPPFSPGVTSAWLADSCARGSWVLDPLGSNPALALEIATAGHRVLVCSNNPVLSFALETLATGPRLADIQAVLAELSTSRRGDERLEQHLQALYQTQCPGCGAAIQPEAFLWRREETKPHARLIACPACGAEGEYPVTPADLDRLALVGSDGLHRSRALERVTAAGDEDRPVVEEALRSYLPRPLYVIFTLLNRAEGLPAAPERKRLLQALLLGLFDEGSSLWSWPGARARPRQLTIPPQFRENNLWLALERAAALWAGDEEPAPLTRWPELPPATGGICLVPGRLKTILPLPESLHPAAAVTLLPRPNQAFWTLSAVWTGWLWGREAVQPMKRFFERQRYDWNWHAGALHSLFATIEKHQPPGFNILGLIPDLSEGFLAAALCGAQAAGFSLNGFAQRPGAAQAQVEWQTGADRLTRTEGQVENLAREGIQAHLEARGEPAGYALLFAAALVHVVHAGGLPGVQPQFPADFLGKFHTAVSKVLAESSLFHRFDGPGQGLESGLWFLVETEDTAAPLADRLESAAQALLDHHDQMAREDFQKLLCAAFPGLLTPPAALVNSLYDALSPATSPNATTGQREPGQAALRALAERMHLASSGSEPMIWSTAGGQPLYCLSFPALGATGAAWLADPPLPAPQCVLVYPERHASWLQTRLQNDPRLAEAVAAGWRLLKAEAAVTFADTENISLEAWEALLNSEPPHWREARQMQMF